MYWTIYSPSEWEKHKASEAAGLVRRKDIASRTIDLVNVSSDDSERQHKYVGSGTDEGFVEERRWRDAGGTGFLSYDLDVRAGAPVVLVCTFRGSEGQRRAFDVLVEGTVIRSDTLEYHPAELLDREYDVPANLTRGKTKITVRLQPQPGARTGGVVEIRTIQPAR